MKNSNRMKCAMVVTSIALGISLFAMNSYEVVPTDSFIDKPHVNSQDSKALEGSSDMLENSAEIQNKDHSNYIAEKKELNPSISRHAQKRDTSIINTSEQKRDISTINTGEVNAGTKPERMAPYTDASEDLDLLARLITAEAQGEPYDAKVAVGSVVMNRVKSKDFPSTISQVIYQDINGYIQFTPVANGWINKPADADSIKAAREAMNGADATNGALFYYDNTTTNSWILQKKVSVQIGNMIYSYY